MPLQFLKFCTIGIINTAIDIVLYVLLTRYGGFTGYLIYVAKVLTFMIATLNSYALNSRWTFQGKHPFSWRHVWRFYLAIGSGSIINLGIHVVDISVFGIHDLISAVIAALVTALLGFTLSKRFVFK